MDDFDDGPRKGNEPSLLTPVGSHGDGKNVSSTALPAKLKTAGDGKSEVGSVTLEEPEEQSNTRQQGSTPGVRKNEKSLRAESAVGSSASLGMGASQCTVNAEEEVPIPDGEECTVNAEEEVPIPDGEECTVNAEEEVPIPDGEECTVDHVDEEANPDEEAPSVDPVQVEENPDQLESGLARWKPLSMERTDYVSKLQGQLPSVVAVYLARFGSRLEMMEAMDRMENRLDNKQDKRHNELVEMLRVKTDKYEEDKIRLEQDRDAEKIERERLQVEEVRLKEERDTALESTKKLDQDREAKKRECEELQGQLRQVSTERNDAREACKRLKQDAEKRENELQELMAQQTNELQELTAQLTNTTHVQRRLKDERNAEKREKEDQLERMTRIRKERDGLLKLNTWLKQDAEKRENELQELVKAGKPFLPKPLQENQDTYPLDPFIGYAIVVSNAVFCEDDDGLVLDHVATESALVYSTLLAQKLYDYGFEVKAMRNSSAMDLLQLIHECDEQQPHPGLVFIYIDAHGEGSRIWLPDPIQDSSITRNQIAAELPKRKKDDKPTILCVSACRRHRTDTKATAVDYPLPGVSSIFFVDACQPGYLVDQATAEHFVDGLVGILTNPSEHDFNTAIAELKRTKDCEGLHYHDQLPKSLVLPRVPAMKRTLQEKAGAKKVLEQFFKYEPQTTTATTP